MQNLVKLSAELEPKARVVKFNCNKANKELGVELKIKVAPTFLLFQVRRFDSLHARRGDDS